MFDKRGLKKSALVAKTAGVLHFEALRRISIIALEHVYLVLVFLRGSYVDSTIGLASFFKSTANSISF